MKHQRTGVQKAALIQPTTRFLKADVGLQLNITIINSSVDVFHQLSHQ